MHSSLAPPVCFHICGVFMNESMCEPKKLIIGILAIQGGFNEHKIALLKCLKQSDGVFNNIDLKIIKVTEPGHLGELDGLILPGGESTTIGKLLNEDMIQQLREWSEHESHVLFGTCAGLILLSKNLEGQLPHQTKLGFLDVTTSRNFFGRQLNSFEGCVNIKEESLMSNNVDKNGSTKSQVCSGVFIRAPAVLSVNTSKVKTLATVQVPGEDREVIVGVQDRNCIGLAFHPELTEDQRWHAYFLKLIVDKKSVH